eukprot:6170530-Amphidinium_carterae.1
MLLISRLGASGNLECPKLLEALLSSMLRRGLKRGAPGDPALQTQKSQCVPAATVQGMSYLQMNS